MSIVVDTPIGALIRAATANKLCAYPEQKPDFTLPPQYSSKGDTNSETTSPRGSDDATPRNSSPEDLEKTIGNDELTIEKTSTVTWYSDDDTENPYNWSSGRKVWVATLLGMYSFAAYIGASLYTVSVDGIMAEYGVSQTVTNLGVTLYIVGYGVGPMVFSPMTEIPAIGRNPPYWATFGIFAILSLVICFVDDIAGILVLRFLLGVFCSPALATVGASYSDLMSHQGMQYAIVIWAGSATFAPGVAPLVAGYAVQYAGWRWSFYELFLLSAPIAVLMLCVLPETSADTILLRRAQRLRALTGRSDLRAESEIRQAKMSVKEVAFNALIKPWDINALDPAVLFSTFYMALAYAIFYSFFESFPIVFGEYYGFGLGSMGLAFLSLLVGLLLAMATMCAYIYFIAPKRFAKMETVTPEARIWPALFATFLIPCGLLIFAWTSDPDIHWIAPMIGVAVAMFGHFIIAQAILLFIPFTYPRYAGSLFAANGLARAVLAGSAILFAPPLFDGLGVDGGVTLLAGLALLCSAGVYTLYFCGESLRKRSRFAES